MDKTKLLDKLNDILRWEWTGVAQYAQASFVVTGLWREVYADLFRKSAKESFDHAKLIGEKIVALGGVPTVERNNVKQSSDVIELLKIGLEFEATAVKLYTESLELCGDDVALRVMLENQVLAEQEGVDHLSTILRDHESSAAAGLTSSKAKVG